MGEEPFYNELRHVDVEDPHSYSALTEFEEDPRFIVKEIVSDKDAAHVGKEVRENFLLARQYLGDFVPRLHVVIGPRRANYERANSAYIVQEKIVGKSLAQVSSDEGFAVLRALAMLHGEGLDTMLARAVQLYLETYDKVSGTGRLLDLHLGNIMVGHLESDATREERVWLVDIFPIGTYSDSLAAHALVSHTLYPLQDAGPIPLPRVRSALNRFMEKFPETRRILYQRALPPAE